MGGGREGSEPHHCLNYQRLTESESERDISLRDVRTLIYDDPRERERDCIRIPYYLYDLASRLLASLCSPEDYWPVLRNVRTGLYILSDWSNSSWWPAEILLSCNLLHHSPYACILPCSYICNMLFSIFLFLTHTLLPCSGHSPHPNFVSLCIFFSWFNM